MAKKDKKAGKQADKAAARETKKKKLSKQEYETEIERLRVNW